MNRGANIRDLLLFHKEELVRVRELARKIREMLKVVEPFIQQHSSVICPGCSKVCCVDRHAHYECDDLIYIHALGLEPDVREQRADDEPCQFLSVTGCRLDRSVRPSGCNWYFCDALYDSMEKAQGQSYADFDAALQELADLWIELGVEFRVKFKEIRGESFDRRSIHEDGASATSVMPLE